MESTVIMWDILSVGLSSRQSRKRTSHIEVWERLCEFLVEQRPIREDRMQGKFPTIIRKLIPMKIAEKYVGELILMSYK